MDKLAWSNGEKPRRSQKSDNPNFKKRLEDLLENRTKENIIIPNFTPEKRGDLEAFL